MTKTRTTVKICPAEKRWLTTTEAEAYLGVSRETLVEMRDSREIDFCKRKDSSSIVWYDRKSIDSFLESRLVNRSITLEASKNLRKAYRQ